MAATVANKAEECYNDWNYRGCTGFDLAVTYEWHAEDVGWPLKSSGANLLIGKSTANDSNVFARARAQADAAEAFELAA